MGVDKILMIDEMMWSIVHGQGVPCPNPVFYISQMDCHVKKSICIISSVIVGK